jgi:transposase-like protein
MSGTKRKVFGAEFKAKVGLEAVRGVKTINQIAQEHGVHPVQVGQWKKECETACKSEQEFGGNSVQI